jgi:hypothetical protein
MKNQPGGPLMRPTGRKTSPTKASGRPSCPGPSCRAVVRLLRQRGTIPSCRLPHDLSPALTSRRGAAGAAIASPQVRGPLSACLMRFEPIGRLTRLKNGAKRTSKQRVEECTRNC